MSEVRLAIHIRTGQRAMVETVDAWLRRHAVELLAFEDAYAACVHLLRHFERIHDVALVGADWLADDEFQILAYLRQTWPRTAVVVYTAQREAPRVDLLPLTRTCRGTEELHAALGDPPDLLVRRICAELPPLTLGPDLLPPAASEARAAGGIEAARSATATRAATGAASLAPPGEPGPDEELATGPPRMVLTAEELAALLGTGRPH